MADRTWVIDVCVTCGAHAVWPFSCGHRPDRFAPGDRPWCLPTTVRGTWKPRGEGDRPHPFHMNSYVGAEPRCWCDRFASDPIHSDRPTADHIGIFDGPVQE